jgi:hypothetical protein
MVKKNMRRGKRWPYVGRISGLCRICGLNATCFWTWWWGFESPWRLGLYHSEDMFSGMIHRQWLSAVPPKTASLSLEEPGQTRRPFIVQDENCRATTGPREPTARQLSAEGSDHLDIQGRPDSAQENTERRARTQDMWLTHRIPRTKLQIPQAGWTTEFRWVPDHEDIKGNEWM